MDACNLKCVARARIYFALRGVERRDAKIVAARRSSEFRYVLREEKCQSVRLSGQSDTTTISTSRFKGAGHLLQNADLLRVLAAEKMRIRLDNLKKV